MVDMVNFILLNRFCYIFYSIVGSIKPGNNTNIYILRGIWLVIDYPLPSIRSLRIDGVLEFEQVCIFFQLL